MNSSIPYIGALQEARHVYIEAGFKTYLERHANQTSITVLEMGFGTGLNTLYNCFGVHGKTH